MTSGPRTIARRSWACAGFRTSILLAVPIPSGSIAQAVPPPPGQIGADCVRPVYASDQLVCADPELRAIDVDIAQRSVRTWPLDLAQGSRVETPETWFRRRGMCAFEPRHRACLVAAYRDRALVVSALTSPASDARSLVCGGAWRDRDLRLSIGGCGVMRVTQKGRLFAVATPPLPGSAWKPVVAAKARRAAVVFTPLGGAAVPCALAPSTRFKD